MVAKDRNHPCVVLYSIGNEISDIGRPDGARRVRELADHLRAALALSGLQPTRRR